MPHHGDLLAELLVRHDVTDVWGQPGAQTSALYDGIAKRPGRIRHHLMRDERAAGYAADAYARLTGRVGVCDVTVGPGATKLPDGLVEALNASVPLLAIVGELPLDWLHYRKHGVASQGMDQQAFFQSMTKATFTVPTTASLANLVRTCFRIATSGRPGPVALLIPHDVIDAEWDPAGPSVDEDLAVDPRFLSVPSFRPVPDSQDLDQAAELLRRSVRPLFVAGGGVHASGAHAELKALAEAVDGCVITSFSGKGSIADTDARAGGVCNPLGSAAARALAKDADLLVWCGSKVGQNTSMNWTLPGEAQATIHIDSDASELGRTFRPTVALNGDLRAALSALAERVERRPRPAWQKHAGEQLAAQAARADEESSDNEAPIQPARLMREISRRLDPDDVVISDASFAAGWISTYIPAQRAGRNFLFARGIGGLGYSVGASLGAAMARPDARIVTISGDGGFGFQLSELATQAQEGHRVVNIVLNNGALGWFAMWEELFFEDLRQSVDLQGPDGKPDYADIGVALGCAGFRVDKPDDLAEALDAAFAATTPSVIDVRIDPRATPIDGYRRRFEQGGVYPRQGTVYGKVGWRRSPGLAKAPAEAAEKPGRRSGAARPVKPAK